MRSLSVRRLAPAGVLGVMIVLSAATVHAQTDSSNFDIRKARDVAVSAAGTLWTIGPDGAPNGSIQRLLASALVTQPGSAVRIAVDPTGKAWVVNSTGELYHWEKADTSSETWVLSDLKAMDVGVGANGSVWAVGTDHRIMGFRNGKWAAISGGGDRIAVDPAGNPWVINSNHEIWHWTGAGWIAVPGQAQDVTVAPDGTVFIVGMTPKPGGFQILKQTGSTWTDVPGAAGVAVAATNRALSLAQLPESSSQVVSVNVPVINQPAQKVIVNPVPVYTQPTTIALQGTTSIPVSGPSGPTSTSPTSTSPTSTTTATSSSNGLRRIFARDQTYEAQVLTALQYGNFGSQIYLNGQIPQASSLSALDRGFAHLAMLAVETYFASQPQVTADQALSQVGSVTDAKARRAVDGILGLFLIAKMSDRSTDPETLALRNWATRLYQDQKIMAAKAALDQYLLWKNDPCGYEGFAPGYCTSMANLYSTRTVPQEKIALKTLGVVMKDHTAEVAAATTAIAAAVAGTALGATTFAAVGLPTVGATITLSTAPVTTSLFAAFGGSGAAASGSAGALGAGWAGVAAAPIAAVVMVIVVGTMEGIKVVEASRVEPMLRLKLGSAMTESIVIENALSDKQASDFFFLAFENAAANHFALPANNVDGEVRFFNQAGFVSRFKLEYTLDGSRKVLPTPALTVGNEATFAIPAAAKAIVASGEWFEGTGWRTLFVRTLPRPTFIGYTSYGTIFQPSFKDEYPEINNIIAKPNELTVTQGGGYVARIRVTYRLNNQDVVAIDNSDISAGWSQVFKIPFDATNIHLMAWTRTGVVWDPWKGIIDKIWPSPPNACIKVYGTTLDPKWNGECH
jgi:Tectonin domain/Thiol-activated cytolysin beta sandwich domain